MMDGLLRSPVQELLMIRLALRLPRELLIMRIRMLSIKA